MVDGLSSRPWSMVLAGVGLVYGTIGVFTLGVTIDVALLAGAIVLMGLAIGAVLQRHPSDVQSGASALPCRNESPRSMPGNGAESPPTT